MSNMKRVKDAVKALQPKSDERAPARVVRGEITSAGFLGSCEATIAEGTAEIEMSYLTSYTPNIGDQVVILVSGADRIILGELA